MNKITYKNYNPRNERIGDCVLRAFSAYFDKELDYETVKKEILKYGKGKYSYTRGITFEKFAKEANMVKINVSSNKKIQVRTFNKAIEFAKQFKTSMVLLSNSHAAYVDHESGLIDTWDSRGKRITYILMHRDDAELLGFDIVEDEFVNLYPSLTSNEISIIKSKGKYEIKK